MRTVTFIFLVLSNLTLFGQVNTSVAEISQCKKVKFDSIKNSFTYSYFHFETDTGMRKTYLGGHLGWGHEKSLDYTVTNLKTNKIVFKREFPFSIVEKIENDSIELKDFNFDSISDFYINFDLEGWGGYFIYNQAKDTFVKDNLLSSLDDIRFDYKKKKITGNQFHSEPHIDKQGVKRAPKEMFKAEYVLKGIGLRHVNLRVKKRSENSKWKTIKKEKFEYIDQRLIKV
jgi:hypothetical protein